MDPAIVAALCCPVCQAPLVAAGAALRCRKGHAFDVARQGYVNLAGGAGGDTTEMIGARARFLDAGWFAPLSDAIVAAVAAAEPLPPGLFVEVGAGTAHHLAAVVARHAGRRGLAVDLSRAAARRAARAHPAVTAVVADAADRLPLAGGAAALVLDVFAPRNAGELLRVLHADGALVVVTPTARHLEELRAALGLLDVDPDKERRLEAALAPRFRRGPPRTLTFTMSLDHAAVADLVAMGPSSWHTEPAARIARLPPRVAVTAEVRIEIDRPSADVAPSPGVARRRR